MGNVYSRRSISFELPSKESLIEPGRPDRAYLYSYNMWQTELARGADVGCIWCRFISAIPNTSAYAKGRTSATSPSQDDSSVNVYKITVARSKNPAFMFSTPSKAQVLSVVVGRGVFAGGVYADVGEQSYMQM